MVKNDIRISQKMKNKKVVEYKKIYYEMQKKSKD